MTCFLSVCAGLLMCRAERNLIEENVLNKRIGDYCTNADIGATLAMNKEQKTLQAY